jgi:hypothetical protein
VLKRGIISQQDFGHALKLGSLGGNGLNSMARNENVNVFLEFGGSTNRLGHVIG